MSSQLKNTVEQLTAELDQTVIGSAAELENYRIKYLGTKGILKQLYQDLKSVDAGDRKFFGQLINDVRNKAEKIFEEQKERLSDTGTSTDSAVDDITRPAIEPQLGARHPLSIIRNRIVNVFSRIGFTVSDGPEIEDDWHNFSALNFPPEHPARDMQDTFFIEKAEGDDKKKEIALRTHTSSVQVRVMETTPPPIRTISPGRVYRNEAISARAHCFFHQVEGLYIDRNVSFADLKQTIDFFAKEMFGTNVKLRFRPSYFPFTEPSAEVDVSCTLCAGEGCNVCKHTGWLEIMGCGMVDPAVLEACGIDSKEFTGFAFGMGVERIAQITFRVTDLRMYSENDVRFLSQFKATL
jgi:phenylalanyl-tRNA synthetase alpha chain